MSYATCSFVALLTMHLSVCPLYIYIFAGCAFVWCACVIGICASVQLFTHLFAVRLCIYTMYVCHYACAIAFKFLTLKLKVLSYIILYFMHFLRANHRPMSIFHLYYCILCICPLVIFAVVPRHIVHL